MTFALKLIWSFKFDFEKNFETLRVKIFRFYIYFGKKRLRDFFGLKLPFLKLSSKFIRRWWYLVNLATSRQRQDLKGFVAPARWSPVSGIPWPQVGAALTRG